RASSAANLPSPLTFSTTQNTTRVDSKRRAELPIKHNSKILRRRAALRPIDDAGRLAEIAAHDCRVAHADRRLRIHPEPHGGAERVIDVGRDLRGARTNRI